MKGPVTATATESLFDLAELGEIASRDFYEGLAEKFRHMPTISEFWGTMAADERKHMKVLSDLRATLTPSQLSAQSEYDVLEAARENSRVRVTDVLAMVRDLNDAYVLAQLWENSEINRVFEFLVKKYLRGSDEGRLVRLDVIAHRNRLVLFKEAFGEVEKRKSIGVSDPEETAGPAG
jgi:hypothetical protein